VTQDEQIAKACERFLEQTGTRLVEVPGDEPRWMIEATGDTFTGENRMQALGAALAGAKDRGMLHGA